MAFCTISGMARASDRTDHSFLLFLREVARARQADATPKEIRSDLPSMALGVLEKRLQVHWLPYRARLVDEEDAEPVCVESVRGLWHERQARKIRERVSIPERDLAPLLDALG